MTDSGSHYSAVVLCGLLALVLSSLARAELCKWVDETGCVHYAEQCPPGVDSKTVEIKASPPSEGILPPPAPEKIRSQDDLTEKELQEALDQSSFEQVSSISQLEGCWEKIEPSLTDNPNPNKIEIYPFEEPRYQYFCFKSAGKLYTYMTTKKPDYSPRKLKRVATALPSVERYSLLKRGLVLIKHQDAKTELLWVASIAKVSGADELYGTRTGDLLMTLRNAKTEEDLYFRHLRKID